MNQPSKPFNIDKRKVYEAYLQVRSNGGAAGASIRFTPPQRRSSLARSSGIWQAGPRGTTHPWF